MLLVYGLPADAQLGRDLLPGPALCAGPAYLYGFQLLQQSPEGGHGTQAHARVTVTGACRQIGSFGHECQCRLTNGRASTHIDIMGAGRGAER